MYNTVHLEHQFGSSNITSSSKKADDRICLAFEWGPASAQLSLLTANEAETDFLNSLGIPHTQPAISHPDFFLLFVFQSITGFLSCKQPGGPGARQSSCCVAYDLNKFYTQTEGYSDRQCNFQGAWCNSGSQSRSKSKQLQPAIKSCLSLLSPR